MNKELTALKELKEILKTVDLVELDELDIIESALKKIEEQDNIINIIKGTIEFGIQEPKMEVKENGEISLLSRVEMNIRKQLKEKERELFREWVLKECFPKEIKALEIIKKKNVDVDFFKYCCQEFNDEIGIEQYNTGHIEYGNDGKSLTQEEYNLLKEVLL